MINEIDLDANGFFEFNEFVILMATKVQQMTMENEITEAFNVLDKEKDNHISIKELKYFMRKVANINISSEVAEAMMKFADGDEDGLVTFDDFAQIYSLVDNRKGKENAFTINSNQVQEAIETLQGGTSRTEEQSKETDRSEFRSLLK